jgi:AcrR family transcriptional regulator
VAEVSLSQLADVTPKVEGRDARWAEHRIVRRRELIEAALRAVHRHGADVGMNEIAATAGTTKAVLYRYFSDRAALHDAVAERVEQNILENISLSLAETKRADIDADGRNLIRVIIGTYLEMIEIEPEIYRFVSTTSRTRHTGDPHGPSSQTSLRHIQELWMSLVPELPIEVAHVWGAAYIGLVRAAADDWLERGASKVTKMPDMADMVTDLIWSGLSPHWNPTVSGS